MDWDSFFIKMAEFVSEKSKDRSTKVGAVIVGEGNTVLSVGYNGFPRGVDDAPDERHQRPAKYTWTEHTERNAIYSAARHGVKLAGAKMYLKFAPAPCSDCSRAVIQAGISEVIMPDRQFVGKGSWDYSLEAGLTMLQEAGVKTRTIPLSEIKQ